MTTAMPTPAHAATMRTERDAMGAIDVPAHRLWGAQTQRSLKFFAISTERMAPELLRALAMVKLAGARVNLRLGLLSADKATAIERAAQEVLAGEHDAEFPLSVWQTGSGTQSHMNMNEVLANRASELLGGERGVRRLVHPNDDVNLGQSSNDVIPTAMHVAAARGINHHLLPALAALRATLVGKSEAFADIVKIGRTHLQDATPLSLGDEFSGYVAQLDQAQAHLQNTLALLGTPARRFPHDLPLLLMAGSEDVIGGEKGNVLLLNAYKRVGLTDLELIVYEGARHEVFNETNKDEVIADLVSWLEARVSH